MIRAVPTLSAFLLSACASTTATPPLTAPSRGECRGDGLAQFAGQPASADVGATILRTSGAKTLQWIEHGGVVTMDFRSDRVRVQLDAVGRIEAARCG